MLLLFVKCNSHSKVTFKDNKLKKRKEKMKTEFWSCDIIHILFVWT